MRFRSRRAGSQSLTLSEAVRQSIAPDGGLYVPESFPTLSAEDFAGLNTWNEIGKRLLEPFFRDDDLRNHLSDICDEAFNFPVTLNFLNNDTAVLELFHRPTVAFKDVGARFYAASSLWYFRQRDVQTGYIVPTGNLGNAVAAFWTKAMGFPIREIVLATNANRALPDYFNTGEWSPHPAIATLANAMDVGNPSNFERLQNLHSLAQLHQIARAFSVTDEEISQTIAKGIDRWGQVWCPHTATAVHVRERLLEPNWILVSTAHPSKFDSIVEPLVKQAVPTPSSLAAVLERPSRFEEIEPTFEALAKALS